MKPSDENPLLLESFSTKAIDYENKEHKLLEELNNPKYDGSISKNKFDVLFSDIYIVKNHNQIKSATDNIGTYSKENNNIRLRKIKEDNKLFLENGYSENWIKNATEEEKEIAKYCIGI